MTEFERKRLKHGIPSWVKDGETYFITINCKQRGLNTLTNKETATAIKEAVQHYSNLGKWWAKLFVIMPDHLHALLSLNTAAHTMSQIISPWKSYLRKTQGIDWQEGYFEHRIRNQDALEEKAHYLRQNPVRAGLVDKPKDWPFVWGQADFEKDR